MLVSRLTALNGLFLLKDQRFDPSGGHRGHSSRMRLQPPRRGKVRRTGDTPEVTLGDFGAHVLQAEV